MRIHIVEAGDDLRTLVEDAFADLDQVTIISSETAFELDKQHPASGPDLVFVRAGSADLQALVTLLKSVNDVCGAPMAVVLDGDAIILRHHAILHGAYGAYTMAHLNAGILRDIIENISLKHDIDESDRQPVSARDIRQLSAPLNYLEFGLVTLADVLNETGKDRTLEFVDHLRETIQAVRKYSEADMSGLSQVSIGRLIESSRVRMRRLADARQVGLRVNWERANFRQAGTGDLAQLGIQHLLEGVIRCCVSGDGVWMQAEKTEEASAIKIHMSRKVLPSADILFAGGSISPGIGLDALSTLQLGALLLQIAPEQVRLGTEARHQLLSIQL